MKQEDTYRSHAQPDTDLAIAIGWWVVGMLAGLAAISMPLTRGGWPV
jgi:hypothetical protein